MPGLIDYTDSPLPPGFPKRLEGSLVWTGEAFEKNPSSYTLELSQEEIWIIEKALLDFKAQKAPRESINRESFKLPENLSNRLKRVSHDVHNGRGFAVVRGLQPAKYSDEDNVFLYAGIASHVCELRTSMRHIFDRSVGTGQPQDVPNLLADSMSFHTDIDAGDVLSLYTANLPQEGGDQYLASSWELYNNLTKEYPEVVKTLAMDWRFEMPTARSGVDVIHRPVLYHVDGKIQTHFARSFLAGSTYVKRLPDGRPLSPKQVRAMDVVHRLCREHCVKLDHQPGDILFVNNLSLLHARDAFKDAHKEGKYRHLLSMMLRDPEHAWALPNGIKIRVDAKFVDGPAKSILSTRHEWEEYGLRHFGQENHD